MFGRNLLRLLNKLNQPLGSRNTANSGQTASAKPTYKAPPMRFFSTYKSDGQSSANRLTPEQSPDSNENVKLKKR